MARTPRNREPKKIINPTLGEKKLMPNRREFDHLVSHNFKVEIEGVTQGEFIFVSGLESTTDAIVKKDGGNIIERKRPGKTQFTNIILRRGYTHTAELWDWYKAVIDGKVERKAGSIIMLGDTGEEILRYNFFEAWPCRWKLGAWDANQADTLVEEIELVVESIQKS